MYYRIWKGDEIPVGDGYTLYCSGPIGEKFPNLDDAKNALSMMANNNFGYSKYKKKKIKNVEKINDLEYIVTLQFRKEVKEKYQILPRK